jgi:hypothetical protein
MNQIKVTNVKALVSLEDSIIAKGETNDCVVYATAAAFDLSYDQAHKVASRVFNRKDRNGVRTLEIMKGVKDLTESKESINGKTIREFLANPKKVYRLHGKDIERKNRVNTFIKEHSQGTYLVITGYHALTVKDGELIDNITRGSGKAFVKRVFKVEPIEG